jgi:ABC-type transporter Mla subunit MlaD
MTARNMEKNTKIEQVSDLNNRTETSGLHYFIIFFSVAWFGIVAVYITQFFGWDNLFSMVPNEFSGFMAGITLPLAIIWVIMAYIDRGNSYRREAAMVQNSINHVIFPDAGANNVTKMVADAIQKQVAELKEATRDAYAQSDVIRRDLAERVNDMRALSEAIHGYSTQALPSLSEEIRNLTANFKEVAEQASSATADFRVNTLQIREDSETLANALTPMVNQMVTAAEHIKEVVNVNNENIAYAQEQLGKYSETSRNAIAQIIDSWTEKGETLEHTFLRTAENCEDLFRKLDSGISHIESSIAEQKKVVEAQSDLLNQNSNYLENKLGEYGKLISLEVEAMVERSGKLEGNVKSQMEGIKETATQLNDLFAKVGDGIVAKRQQLEIEGSQMVKNISEVIERLAEEIGALKEYYDSTQSKNGDMNKVFAAVADNLQQIEGSLNDSLSNFSAKTDDIISKFNSVSGAMTVQLNQSFSGIDNRTNDILGKFKGVDETINNSLSQSLNTISIKTDSLINKFNGVNDIVTESLDKTLAIAEQRAKGIVDKFNDMGDVVAIGLDKTIGGLGNKTDGILNKFKEVSDIIGSHMNKLTANSDSMAEQSKINASLLIEQDEYVNKSLISLKQITNKIATANDELTATGSKIGETLNNYENQMNGFSKTVNRHIEDLSASYDKAKQQIDELEQKYKSTSIDTFMKSSADIISELEALSIDVHGIFNKNGNDKELWKQYYAGDHGVFVRYLSNNMTKNEIATIRQDYESKPDFRVVVDKYLDDFNTLIASARKNNRAGTLLALISGSDIGKVYYVLARALGKLN